MAHMSEESDSPKVKVAIKELRAEQDIIEMHTKWHQ